MVNVKGQGGTEFILMLVLLTSLGIAIMKGMTPKNTGAVDQMKSNAVTQINTDKD